MGNEFHSNLFQCIGVVVCTSGIFWRIWNKLLSRWTNDRIYCLNYLQIPFDFPKCRCHSATTCAVIKFRFDSLPSYGQRLSVDFIHLKSTALCLFIFFNHLCIVQLTLPIFARVQLCVHYLCSVSVIQTLYIYNIYATI